MKEIRMMAEMRAVYREKRHFSDGTASANSSFKVSMFELQIHLFLMHS
jgi:hypothetical protein